MARQLRIDYEGALHHITSRGIEKNNIFIDDADRNSFLEILSHIVTIHQWLCYSYCLMGNHYHLLIETPHANLSKGMKMLNSIYSQKFNKKNNRVGPLLQGRYKSILIQKETHLFELCRYIVLNPIRSGMVKKPEQWPWSSYSATIGRVKSPPFLFRDEILSYFSNDRITAINDYINFVFHGIDKEAPWKGLKQGIYLCEEDYLKKLDPIIKNNKDILEIKKGERFPLRKPLEIIFSNTNTNSKKTRDKMIYEAFTQHGYSQIEISKFLKMHYSTTSRIIKLGSDLK